MRSSCRRGRCSVFPCRRTTPPGATAQRRWPPAGFSMPAGRWASPTAPRTTSSSGGEAVCHPAFGAIERRSAQGERHHGGVTRRVHPSMLPASGAWRPGDHPGQRRFLSLAIDRPFVLEGGGSLCDITVAYETWGALDADGGNAVLVCHALTGDSHAAGPLVDGHSSPGWWDALIGPGKALDTDRYFVVCANVLGGCQGTTGPASPDP